MKMELSEIDREKETTVAIKGNSKWNCTLTAALENPSFKNLDGKKAEGQCPECADLEDTPEHTWDDCPLWKIDRERLTEVLGAPVSYWTLTSAMMENRRSWDAKQPRRFGCWDPRVSLKDNNDKD